MLTKTQSEALHWINAYARKHGYGPSYVEIAEGLGYRSLNSVAKKVQALEDRGWIKRHPNRARAIEVLKLPETEA